MYRGPSSYMLVILASVAAEPHLILQLTCTIIAKATRDNTGNTNIKCIMSILGNHTAIFLFIPTEYQVRQREYWTTDESCDYDVSLVPHHALLRRAFKTEKLYHLHEKRRRLWKTKD